MSRFFFPALCLDQCSWVLHTNNNNSHRIAVPSPKHPRVSISLHLCLSTSTLQPQILHCTQKLPAITHSTLPELLRVFITLLEAETTSPLNACLPLLQMAGKSCTEVGVESPSGDYPRANMFTLKSHQPLSIYLKATENFIMHVWNHCQAPDEVLSECTVLYCSGYCYCICLH